VRDLVAVHEATFDVRPHLVSSGDSAVAVVPHALAIPGGAVRLALAGVRALRDGQSPSPARQSIVTRREVVCGRGCRDTMETRT
jgi:hypothetical protein